MIVRFILLFVFIIFISCDRCDNVDCAPCPPNGGVALQFDTSQEGYTLKELDSTLVIKYDALNSMTPVDTTYILTDGPNFSNTYGIKLENPSFSLNYSRYEFLVIQKDGLFSKNIKRIQFANFPSDGKGCCNCSYYQVKSFMVNDTLTSGVIPVAR